MNLIKLFFSSFLLISTLGFAQKVKKSKMDLLLKKWELVQFEKVDNSSDKIIINKTKYAENIAFNFKDNFYLEVVYSETKKEVYKWYFKKNYLIEIIPVDTNNYNQNIIGQFLMHDLNNISQLFLQHKGQPHNGIMLKLSKN
ncbi:MAG: hypothetical protein JXK08_05415 [Flavobacteriaceae bacterium]|nr:hypothetical protein [Flavobacteriaceae bacterium]